MIPVYKEEAIIEYIDSLDLKRNSVETEVLTMMTLALNQELTTKTLCAIMAGELEFQCLADLPELNNRLVGSLIDSIENRIFYSGKSEVLDSFDSNDIIGHLNLNLATPREYLQRSLIHSRAFVIDPVMDSTDNRYSSLSDALEEYNERIPVKEDIIQIQQLIAIKVNELENMGFDVVPLARKLENFYETGIILRDYSTGQLASLELNNLLGAVCRDVLHPRFIARSNFKLVKEAILGAYSGGDSSDGYDSFMRVYTTAKLSDLESVSSYDDDYFNKFSKWVLIRIIFPEFYVKVKGSTFPNLETDINFITKLSELFSLYSNLVQKAKTHSKTEMNVRD